MVTIAQFEQAILARTFFDPNALLVFDSGTIDGWCLSYRDPESPERAVIAAICLSNQGAPSFGSQLLQTAETRIASEGIEHIHVGAVRDRSFGLAGLNPIGHGIGIPMHDTHIASILTEQGYAERQAVQRMTATVSGYRPPVSRETMQLRRSSQVISSNSGHPNTRASAGMSHLDIETHRLENSSGNELTRLNVWFSDPEAEVMDPTRVILDLTMLKSDDKISAVEGYLIGTIVQSLVARGIATVETAIDLNQQVLIAQMRTLGFEATDSGIGWEKG